VELLSQLAQRLYDGDAPGVAALAGQALEQGIAAEVILAQGLMAGIDRVGQDFQAGELFVPELIVAARAMHAGIDLVRPHLARSGERSGATIVLGTVKGDLHDIGKRLVGIMMEGAGLQVVDLGCDVPAERFAEAVRAEGAELVGLSALLSTTMPMMRSTIETLRGSGLAEVRVLVGGAPVTQAWADEIGADGYAPDAVSAVALARGLLA
jgi:5-methyltetrahydrofolate--homocysteine methyltransferase